MARLFFGYSHKLTALVLILSIIPTLMISSYLYSDKVTNETYALQEKLDSMSTVAATDSQNWLDARKKIIQNIGNNQLIIKETNNIRYSTNIDELFSARLMLTRQFSAIAQNNDWIQQFVINDATTGDILFHTDLYFPEGNIKNEKYFQDAVNGKVGISDIYRSLAPVKNEYGVYEQGVPTLLVSAPIKGEVGVESILTVRLDAHRIIPESDYREDSFVSLDKYVVNSEGYFLSKPKFLNDILFVNDKVERNLIKNRPELTLQATVPQSTEFTKIFQLADADSVVSNVDGYENYVGDTVVGSIAPIIGTGWYYVVEIDKNEAAAGIIDIQNGLLMYISISLVIIVAVAVLVARNLINPINRLTKVVKIIGEGNFDVAIDPTIKGARDEIGILATQFDNMRNNIKLIQSSLTRANSELLSDKKALKKLAESYEEQNRQLERLNYQAKNDKLKFEELYNGSPDLYRTIDTNGIILDCNTSYAKKLGYSKEEVIGRSIFEHVPEDSTEAMRSSLETWQKYGIVSNKEITMKRKDGTTFPALISATNLYDSDGALIGSNTIIRDMSDIYKLKEIKDQNDKLLQLNAHVTQLIEQEKEANRKISNLNVQFNKIKHAFDKTSIIAVTDKDGIITYANDEFCRVSKYSREELIGQNHRILKSGYHPPEFYKGMWHTISNGYVWNGEIKNKAKDGSMYWVKTSIIPILDADGKPKEYVSIRIDITEVKKKQEELAASKRKIQEQYQLQTKLNEEISVINVKLRKQAEELRHLDHNKEEFSSMVAHELKTPLVPILLYCELLLDERLGNLTPKQKEKIKIMYDSAKSLSELVQDVLDVHRLELGRIRFEIRETSIKELVDVCVNRFKPLAQAKNVKLISNVDSQSTLIQCDSERIVQILNNLVNNALRFVAENEGKIAISATKRNGSVIFSVKDNGIGIPKDKQQNLFKKFYQVDMSNTRSGGSGLGLAICKGIVDAHEGKIWCESEEGKGSAFYFSIPVLASNKVIENC